MNILIHGYNTCCQNHMGGLQARARKIRTLLEAKGNNVSFFSAFDSKLVDTDILHIFMATEENYNLIKCAKAKGCKVVISSIINLVDGKKMNFIRKYICRIPKLATYQKRFFEVFQLADFIISETQKEKDYLIKYYGVNSEKIEIIPNGVDVVEKYRGQEIKDIVTEPYILCVGRFDRNKNQLNLIKAMKNTGIDLVFIGGAEFSKVGQDYYKKCLEEAKNNEHIHFLGWQDHDAPLLKSAYANAELVVVPSYNETFGMVLLEGGMAGTKLSMSNTLPILEYNCFKDCKTFDPSNYENMREVIMAAYKEKNFGLIRQKLIDTFSWPNVIDKHLELYERLLNNV